MTEDSSPTARAASPGRTAATDGDTDEVAGDPAADGADATDRETDDRVAISDGGELLEKPPVGDGGREEPDSDSDSDDVEVTVDEPAGLIDTDLNVELEPQEEEERWRLDEEEVEVHGGTGPQRVVAEQGVDEVFATFEESTPEEVMAAASEQEPEEEADEGAGAAGGDDGTDVAADPEVREDVERLLGDLSEADVREEPSLDASELADRTGDAGGLFVETGGHRRVVGDADPDAVFEEFEESTPEEVMAAASEQEPEADGAFGEFGVDVPAAGADADAEESATATEKPLQPRSTEQTMNVGRDRADGGRPEEGASEGDVDLESALAGVTFDDGGDDEGIGAFVDDSEETLVERADDDRHRAVGESDVDAVFEEFEESTPEEVMAASEQEPEEATDAETGADADVEGLFGDLSGVDVEPTAEPDEPTYDTPDPDDPEATAAEIEGLMGDLATMEVDEDAESDVEAMFGELSGVEVPEPREADDAEAGETTVETSLDTGPDTLEAEETGIDAFQWLGEDVHIFEPGEQAVDDVFEAFEESSPEEVIAADSPDIEDTSATDMYRSLGEDGSVARAGSVSDPAGWERDGADVVVDVDVRATAMYDDIAGDSAPRVQNGSDAGTAPAPDADPDSDDGDLDVDLDDPADDLDLEVPPADDPDGDDGEDGGSEIDLDLEDPADDVAIDLNDPESDASDQLDLDVPDPDPDPDAGDGADAGTTAESDEDDGIELDVPDPEEVDDADATGDASSGSGTDTTATGSGGSTTAQPTTDESDVDAVFERFEGDSPEEIVASADDPAAEAADDDVEIDDADVDRLFGDLSTVDLEAQEPEPEPEPTPVGDAPEPGSQEAESEVEGLLADLSAVDLEAREPEAATAPEPQTVEPSVGARTDEADADAGTHEDVLEQTGDDTHVAVGESDVDAVFERFEETSPEEIVEGFEFELDGETTTASSDDFQFDVSDDDGDDFDVVDEADATATSGDDDTAGSPSVGDSPSASSTSRSTSTSTSASPSSGSSTSSVGDTVLDDPDEPTTGDSGPDATTTGTDADENETTTAGADADEADRYSATDDGPGSEPLFPEVAEKADERDQRAEPDDGDDDDSGGIVSKIAGVFSRILGVF